MLKENFKIINEEEECEMMQNHIGLLEQANNIINQWQPSHVSHDHVAFYLEDLCSKKIQPLVNCESENKDDEELVL